MDKIIKEMKKEAVAQLASLCEQPVENSRRGIHEAVDYVKRYGSTKDCTSAELIAMQWMHFDCEERTMEAQKNN